MGKRVGIEVSIALADAVGMCDPDVIAAYPITPQTHIVEHLSELVADGECDAEFIPVESEHAAMSTCCGSAAAGARTYTATSSQGLVLMNEVMFIAPPMRLPIVMTVVNRALSAPINIWNDHSDIMAQRDTGWLQTFAENGQEAVDLMLHAFRVAEDKRVSLPMIVNLDGFIVSHVIEPIIMPEQADIERYLPTFEPIQRLDVDNPVLMGAVGIPDVYTEIRYATDQTVRGAHDVMVEAWDEFEQIFGRSYKPVETYRADGADVLFVTMGAIGETCMTWIDGARDAGSSVGSARIRMWRPFPGDDFVAAVSGAKVIIVLDRAQSLGSTGNPVAHEVKSLLFNEAGRPDVLEYVVGLGGRDVFPEDFQAMYDAAVAVLDGAAPPPPTVLQVRVSEVAR
jgi:pyruvate ferredoxin oxidoreductase alpha subunit